MTRRHQRLVDAVEIVLPFVLALALVATAGGTAHAPTEPVTWMESTP